VSVRYLSTNGVLTQGKIHTRQEEKERRPIARSSTDSVLSLPTKKKRKKKEERTVETNPSRAKPKATPKEYSRFGGGGRDKKKKTEPFIRYYDSGRNDKREKSFQKPLASKL